VRSRVLVSQIGLVLTLLSVAAAGHRVQAQGARPQASPGTGDLGGLSGLLANPGELATTMVNAALVSLMKRATSILEKVRGQFPCSRSASFSPEPLC
jgi:hypothetical protein